MRSQWIKSILFMILVSLMGTVFGQSKSAEKPMRIGIKIGLPNVAGLSFERAMGTKFALSLDASYFPINLDNAKIKPSYFELAGSYYFKSNEKGLYGQVGLGRLGFNAQYTNESFGTAKTDLGIGFVNFRIGAKLGRSFYFRPEIGYGLLLTGTSFSLSYIDLNGAKTTVKERFPGSLSGGFIGSVGFGVAF